MKKNFLVPLMFIFLIAALCSGFALEETSWPVLSLSSADYGIDYETEDMEDVCNYPLDKLVAYYLNSDGAYSQGSSHELRNRFLEAPGTVLAYISLMGGEKARETDPLPAWQMLCSSLAYEDVFWANANGVGEEEKQTGVFDAIIEEYKGMYPSGSMSDILVYLEDAHKTATQSISE